MILYLNKFRTLLLTYERDKVKRNLSALFKQFKVIFLFENMQKNII